MDLSFILGFLGAAAVIVYGIVSSGDIGNFIDLSSIWITVFGTLLAMMASFPMKVYLKMFKVTKIVLGRQKFDPEYYINTIGELSEDARKKGLLALEDQVSGFTDSFLKSSVMLIVDAIEPDKVRQQLDSELSNIEMRHAQVWAIFDKGAALAPGFGMIGTLIGLINMLAGMDLAEEGGAQKLAKNMAVALVTTFYGSFMANVLFIPIGNQLRQAHEKEMICKEIVMEGVLAMQAGDNPRNIREKLMTYLSQAQQAKMKPKES
ncbi:MotA/TolQ/ExbB proton channel family protein [Oscillospiraceae bacterium MB08-C2-2]|nr:MotA/TolQ/ExbB proton channel family protein [Oscillospiraceae bacterium MB08-C2-2]